MPDGGRRAEVALRGGTLAATIGPLADDPDTPATLQASERLSLTRWRDERWAALERRAGSLAPRDVATWYELLVSEGWRRKLDTHGLPPAGLELFYRLKRFIPRRVQLGMRRRLIKRQGSPVFPAWPFEVAGFELVRIAIADALLERDREALRFPWFWPDGATAAVALTHDVESADGLARAGEVAAWEELHGFRSSFNVVSDWYPVDMERGADAGRPRSRDRLSRHSPRPLPVRLPGVLRTTAPTPERRCEAPRGGRFSLTATHRVVEWLAELPFAYDCTMPHSDPHEPIPGGTATTWPFFHGDVVELPYTAPQDHTLFNLLGHRDSTLWRRQLDSVIGCNGLFQVITHPDREYLGQATIANAYRDLLGAISLRDDVWVALPREIADWWRLRSDGLTPQTGGIARWTGSQIGFCFDPGYRSESRAG